MNWLLLACNRPFCNAEDWEVNLFGLAVLLILLSPIPLTLGAIKFCRVVFKIEPANQEDEIT